jgi:hypothetical protein
MNNFELMELCIGKQKAFDLALAVRMHDAQLMQTGPPLSDGMGVTRGSIYSVLN